jgi:hypothetical protein
MAISFPLVGGCYCGDVRYEIFQEPNSIGICHCVSCRRTAGAESVGWAVLDAESFEYITKQPRTFRSSRDVERSFCNNCGTTLTYRRDDRPFVDVTIASLDDPEVLKPTKETWCVERLSWNQLNDSLAHHERSSSS